MNLVTIYRSKFLRKFYEFKIGKVRSGTHKDELVIVIKGQYGSDQRIQHQNPKLKSIAIERFHSILKRGVAINSCVTITIQGNYHCTYFSTQQACLKAIDNLCSYLEET